MTIVVLSASAVWDNSFWLSPGGISIGASSSGCSTPVNDRDGNSGSTPANVRGGDSGSIPPNVNEG